MKSVYTLATVFATLLVLNVSAQYTAVRNGNWSAAPGPNYVWDLSGQPPALCNSCTITINSGFTVHLNTSITLAAGSTLKVGSDGINAAFLEIGKSNGTDWASSNNILLLNDGLTAPSQVILGSNTSTVNTDNPSNQFDGILIASGTDQTTAAFEKQVGLAPNSFIGTRILTGGPATFGPTLNGPVTLSSGGILPILLADFNAVLNKSDVDLTWATAMELNSDHFAVQRLNTTVSPSTWEIIGTVHAQGNSSLTVQYSFTDESPLAGVNEYRLESVDRDGKFNYSEIKVVHLGALGVKVFPNPASDYVNVNISSNASGTQSIRLVSQNGQLLTERKVDNAAGTVVSLPISSYPQGNYLIIVTGADGSRQVSKLFISRL